MKPKRLEEICDAYQLSTKWLVCPSHRTGHQWIEILVRSGQSVVNLHPTTIIRLALDFIGAELSAEGLTLASRDIGLLAIESSWPVLSREGYLGQLQCSTNLCAAAYESLLSLKLAGCSAASIDDSCVDSATKADDVKALLRAYEEFLQTHNLVDEADVLHRAIQMIRQNKLPVGEDTFVLVPPGIHLDVLQKKFIDALPATLRIDIEHPSEHLRDSNSTVHFLRAVGEINEVREVLRRCFSTKQSLDDLEILCTDYETYVPLIYSTGLRYYRDPDRPGGIPVTFAEGIPTTLSRPGRALIGWLNWIHGNFPQRLLFKLIGDGLLNCGTDDELSCSYLVRILSPLAIGIGKDNYLRKLDQQLAGLQNELAKPPAEGDVERHAAAARKRKGFLSLRKSISRLLELSEPIAAKSNSTAILKAAETFLTAEARSITELDRSARDELVAQLQQRQVWITKLGTAVDVQNWLTALPSQTRVLGSSPKPGHLHVSSISSGGHSGRKRTFLIGLDDRRFPGAAAENPILLDHERARLSDSLTTSAVRFERRIADFDTLRTRLQGSITLSWSCYDLIDDREMFASSVVLAEYRNASGEHETDLAALNNAVGPPASFAPTASEESLDSSDLWLWYLSTTRTPGCHQLDLIGKHFPHLGRGRIAMLERSRGFGRFNGYVPQAGTDLNPLCDPGPVVSASSLETAGRCLLAYFFRSGLELFPLQDTEVDLDQWLDAAQFGQLMHEVFRQFMTELHGAGKLPNFHRDHVRLAQIVYQVASQWRSDFPPPNENAFRTQYWQLVRTARIFLQAEEEFCANSTPRFFEVALGLNSLMESPLDDSAPIPVDLLNGQSLRARGRVDRIDEVTPHRYSIWDYKLGSAYGFDKGNAFHKGRRIQSILYVRMVETALRKTLDPEAIVERFGYFFPSVRAHGLRVDWTAEQLQHGIQIMLQLCLAIQSGAFLATDNQDDCRWCDYESICGDVKTLSSMSGRLVGREDLVELRLVRDLRRG